MEARVLSSEDLSRVEAGSLLLLVYEDEGDPFDQASASVDKALSGKLTRLVKAKEITGKFKDFVVLGTDTLQAPRLIVIGAGKKSQFGLDKLRSVVARGARIARRLSFAQLAVPVGAFLSLDAKKSADVAAEGFSLGLYRFKKYKSAKPDSRETLPKELLLVVCRSKESEEAKNGIKRGKILASAINFVRDMVNEPSNRMTPLAFTKEAESLAKENGIQIKILEREEIQALGMEAFLSVAKGSKELPKLVVLSYKGGKDQAFTLGLVGKGVTFDSGGISIKPSEDMHYMTSDMAGAAACLGAMKAMAELRLPLNVTAVLPLAENLPGGNAYKPGDIVKSYTGKTIEIINTDAEGRLLLADALGYICTMKVNAVVDLATLTGGVVVALGHVASGVFSTHGNLLSEVMASGQEADEPLWQLPLFEEYGMLMKGSLADLKNSGGRYGAPCSAAAFLKEFVGDTPWAHIDIAGTARVDSDKIPYTQRPYLPKSGGTGVGVRTLVHLAERLCKKTGL